jgi:hypothetical protein
MRRPKSGDGVVLRAEGGRHEEGLGHWRSSHAPNMGPKAAAAQGVMISTVVLDGERWKNGEIIETNRWTLAPRTGCVI